MNYKKIFEMSLDAIVVSDDLGNIILWNPGAERMFGYATEEALGMPVTELMPEEYRQKHLNGIARFRKTERPVLIGKTVEVEGLRKDGSRFLKEISLAGEKVEGRWIFTAIMRDITERKHMEEELHKSEERFKALTENTSDWIWEVDENAIYTYASPKIKDLLGYEPEEVLGKKPFELMPPDETERVVAEFKIIKETQKPFSRFENTNLHKDGHLLVLETSGVPIFDAIGNFRGYRGIDRDITERKESDEALRQAYRELELAATTERLTKLLNRASFEKDEKELDYPVLLLMNIDGFKHVNDFYGIQAGDFVLKEIAACLNNIIPEYIGAKIYKLGGDDFGILFESNPDYDPVNLAKLIIDTIEDNEFVYNGNNISISISIGIARERPVLEKADMVLKHLKRHLRLKYLEYTEELSLYKNISENMRVLNILKKAINSNSVISYFQPICNNRSGMIEKYECLVRVIDETGKVLSPFSFLKVAKESKLYGEITKRMIENGVSAFKDKRGLEFSLNISVEDINDTEIEGFIEDVLKKNQEIACRTTFEIVESEGIDNYEVVYDFINKVKKYGCKIAIDDFGAGYSNFGHTMQLNIDYLKIDASLIKEIDRNEKLQILTETIVSYARRLGIKTIAEYVHSEEVHKKVKALGVDYSQGYYIGEPKPTIE